MLRPDYEDFRIEHGGSSSADIYYNDALEEYITYLEKKTVDSSCLDSAGEYKTPTGKAIIKIEIDFNSSEYDSIAEYSIPRYTVDTETGEVYSHWVVRPGKTDSERIGTLHEIID